jgi:hypothetical protein
VSGQILKFQITNNGSEPLWYAALYCDADFRIEVWGSGQVLPGKSPSLSKARVDATSFGPEGMIVFALPVSVTKEQPNFEFLQQQSLGKAEDALQPRVVGGVLQTTSFGKLLAAAAFNSGTRSFPRASPTTPAVRSVNWTVLPAAPSPSK